MTPALEAGEPGASGGRPGLLQAAKTSRCVQGHRQSHWWYSGIPKTEDVSDYDLRSGTGASDMAQWVKATAAKSDAPSPVPGEAPGGRRNLTRKSYLFTSTRALCHVCACGSAHTIINGRRQELRSSTGQELWINPLSRSASLGSASNLVVSPRSARMPVSGDILSLCWGSQHLGGAFWGAVEPLQGEGVWRRFCHA